MKFYVFVELTEESGVLTPSASKDRLFLRQEEVLRPEIFPRPQDCLQSFPFVLIDTSIGHMPNHSWIKH